MERLYSQGEKYKTPFQQLLTREAWVTAMVQFPPEVRHHAANLAAHDWDVTLVGDRLLITAAHAGGHWLTKNGERSEITVEEWDALYPRVSYDTSSEEALTTWYNATHAYDPDDGLGRSIKRQRKIVFPVEA
jgi:hypothetical protein